MKSFIKVNMSNTKNIFKHSRSKFFLNNNIMLIDAKDNEENVYPLEKATKYGIVTNYCTLNN